MDVPGLRRQVEHKFAPAPLIVVQALANTFSFEDGEELLGDVDATRRWLLDSDLAVAAVAVDEPTRERLIAFREVVRALIDANLTGEPNRDANAGLARIAESHPVPVVASEAGEISLDLAPAADVDGVIAQMIGIILQAQIDDTWRRLKVCAADDCRWAFYDSSRNRGGTWCQMEVCGNREKNRSYRARRAAAG